MKLIVAGGRDYNVTGDDVDILERVVKELGVTEIVEGDSGNVDLFAMFWAQDKGIRVRPFAPDYATYGSKRAPHVRNEEMAKYGDVLLAYPGQGGTRSMIDKARRHKRPVILVCKDSSGKSMLMGEIMRGLMVELPLFAARQNGR